MADKHMQILSNLIKAVSNVAERGSSRSGGGFSSSDETSTSVENSIKRLFPSTDQTAKFSQGTVPNQANARETNDSDEEGNEMPDRQRVSNITHFNPNSIYRPKSGKRAKSSTSKAPKKQRNTNTATERKCVKDVILLPGPKVSCVPKGVAREELFVRGFTTTFELSTSMSEEEVRDMLGKKLKDKLGDSPGSKFTFVRAVSNKIIAPDLSKSECFNGRMIKHFSGQGPVYIRANKDISSPLIQWQRVAADSSSDESDDGAHFSDHQAAEHIPLQTQLVLPNSDLASESVTTQPSTSNANQSSSRNPKTIKCPTCRSAFPAEDIEAHADACAEEKFGSFGENEYELRKDLFDMNNHEPPTIISDDEISNEKMVVLTPENHKSKILEALTKLNTLVPEQHNRYHIRRKTMFDDYVSARERCKWMKPENKLKVSFIGEPGLDGGGPRREFLTGAV